MMTQPVQGWVKASRSLARSRRAICSGMSCLKDLQCLVDHALKDRPLKKYEFTHAFSPDPGWGPGSAPAREGRRGRTPGLDQDSRASLSSMLLSTQNFQQDSQLKTAVLHLPGEEIKLPIISGTEDEQAIDITSLRDETGYITVDPGYSNTGACESKITFIDGESGVLRYRGYPIEELAEHSTFVETAWLLIYGELPTGAQLARFRELLTEQELLHEGMRHHFEGFPPHGHPMAMLSAMINACGCYHPELLDTDLDQDRFLTAVAILMSKVRTIAALS